jgi:hypothetical protein
VATGEFVVVLIVRSSASAGTAMPTLMAPDKRTLCLTMQPPGGC